MKITSFDKPSIKAIRVSINDAMKKVEEEYGIKISAGNASFSNNEVTFKLKANVIGDGGVVQTREAQAWDIYASQHGLSHLAVGDTIELMGKSFTISGYNTRARKSPINIVDMNGRHYKCSVEMIKNK
jgi:hypothetical protein